MRYLFTCGGTAGHINPALGVAERIMQIQPDAEILFVGAAGKMETELVPREGFDIKTITITNIRRGIKPADIVHNAKTLKNIVASTAASKRILKEFKPDVAVGTGGYVCYPVLKAAASLGIPTAVHESNAVPGLTTSQLAGVVDRIMVGFEESRKEYKHPEKVIVTGTPVRTQFDPDRDPAQAKEKLGLPADKPLVLSVWGSLGASKMNEIIVGVIERALRKPAFSLIHSAGTRGYDAMEQRMREEGIEGCAGSGFLVKNYIYNMPDVMAAADIIICRSGASTLSELGYMGKPAILVPSPNVTNNHQEKNARVLEAKGAARVILESDCSADKLIGMISELLKHPDTLSEMSKRMKSFGNPDATDRIADIIIGLARK